MQSMHAWIQLSGAHSVPLGARSVIDSRDRIER